MATKYEGIPIVSETTSLLPRFRSGENGRGSDGRGADPAHGDKEHDDSNKIGYLGSIAIAVNSLAGPAVLQLPFQYQESGLIPTTICLVLVAILSAFCSLHMANVVSCIPGNKHFTKCVEFSDAFGTFLGPRFYRVTQILFFLTAICLNTAAMVDTAQVVDSVLGMHSPTGSVALDIGGFHSAYSPFATGTLDGTSSFSSPEPGSWWLTWSHPKPCTRRQVKLGLCEPFADSETSDFLLTAGYVVTAAVFLPICLMDLKENTNWQIGGFLLTLTICTFFCIQFAFACQSDVEHAEQQYQQRMALYMNTSSQSTLENPPQEFSPIQVLTHNAPLYGTSYTALIGVILFNFTLVLALPAWLYEKKSHVRVQTVVAGATCLSTVLYISVGALAAMAIPNANVNMLSPMVAGTFGSSLAVAGSLFSFFIIGLDIPLFSVLTRYNLTHSGLCSERMANLLVVWVPWSVAWMLYQGDAVGQLLEWGGTLLTSAVAFLLPLFLALVVLTNTDAVGSIQVYGERLWTTRSAQINALYCLFYVTVMAVLFAVGGKVASAGNLAEYLQSEEYLNGSGTFDWPGMVLDMAMGE